MLFIVLLHSISHIISQGVLVFLFHVCLDKEVQLEIHHILKPKRKSTFGSSQKKKVLLRSKQKSQINTEDKGRNLSTYDLNKPLRKSSVTEIREASSILRILNTEIGSSIIAPDISNDRLTQCFIESQQ